MVLRSAASPANLALADLPKDGGRFVVLLGFVASLIALGHRLVTVSL